MMVVVEAEAVEVGSPAPAAEGLTSGNSSAITTNHQHKLHDDGEGGDVPLSEEQTEAALREAALGPASFSIPSPAGDSSKRAGEAAGTQQQQSPLPAEPPRPKFV